MRGYSTSRMSTANTMNAPAPQTSSLSSGAIGLGPSFGSTSLCASPSSVGLVVGDTDDSDLDGRAAPLGGDGNQHVSSFGGIGDRFGWGLRRLGRNAGRSEAEPARQGVYSPRRMNTTKPIRASASVKAMPRNIVVRTMPAASG